MASLGAIASRAQRQMLGQGRLFMPVQRPRLVHSSGGGVAMVERRSLTRWRRRAALVVGLGGVAWVGTAGRQWQDLSEEGLPKTFEPEQISAFWQTNPRLVAWRLSHILAAVLPFLGSWAAETHWGRLVGRSEVECERLLAARASQLRELLVSLGPAFIKFGQMLSTRPDLLPQTVLVELRQLCDSVPPFPTARALEIVRKELGREPNEVFEAFDEDTAPIAAASLGQVYCLRLRNSGKKVAVKVQRPDMIRAVALDLFLLRNYCKAVEGVKAVLMRTGVMTERKQFDVELLDSFASGSYLELDYCNEGRNQDRFRSELVPMLDGKIRVPEVFWDATSRKVLTSEWIDGEQLVRSSPAVIKRLVPVGVECFLMQLLEMGFFHSDPHPGNLLVDAEKRLCLIDFGLCANVPMPDTRTMTEAIVHLMEGDVPSLVDDAVLLGFLPPSVDKTALLADLTRIFRESKLAAEAAETTSFQFQAIQTRRKKFKDVSRELNAVFYEYPFLVPDYFALITRALIVLEGIAVVGDPDFDIFSAAYPYAFRRSAALLEKGQALRLGRAALKIREAQSTSRSWFPWPLRGALTSTSPS